MSIRVSPLLEDCVHQAARNRSLADFFDMNALRLVERGIRLNGDPVQRREIGGFAQEVVRVLDNRIVVPSTMNEQQQSAFEINVVHAASCAFHESFEIRDLPFRDPRIDLIEKVANYFGVAVYALITEFCYRLVGADRRSA